MKKFKVTEQMKNNAKVIFELLAMIRLIQCGRLNVKITEVKQ